MKIFSRYDLPDVPGFVSEGPSLTQQHFKEECDINNIIAKYASGIQDLTPENVRNLISQVTPPEQLLNRRQPVFGDYYSVKDYQSAQNILREADEAFNAIPSYIRLKFGNDPAQFLEWLHDPKNKKEAEQYGFFVPEQKVIESAPEVLESSKDGKTD